MSAAAGDQVTSRPCRYADERLAAGMVVVSTLLSILTLPLFAALVQMVG